jgi:predicted regulator of Ras-like GTPase activity (Roadblock/LC7/MglB family)
MREGENNMLSSLFGDLRGIRGNGQQAPEERDQGFAATAILESVATEVNDHGQMVDSHLRDLVVSGSPAQAIRDHFASTRADLETASRLIALYDPTGVWAASVIKALSDASGRPIERLHLREQGTLRTLAMIERTTLERRHEDALRIYHADVRAPGASNAAVPLALMERSHMTAVIVGAMQPHDIDDMLQTLQTAVNSPNWRCPTLLFMLPPNAVWIANKIGMTEWPARLKVQVLNEALTSASAVWNSLLGMWNRVKKEPVWAPPQAPAATGLDGFQIKVADLSAAPSAASAATVTNPVAHAVGVAGAGRRPPLDPALASQALETLGNLDGVFACAVVDASTGLILAKQARADQPIDLDLAAATSAQVLRAHQHASRQLGLTTEVDEVMTSAGPRHHVMRTVSRHRGLFLFAVLDKQRTNLALARYKLMEAEQGLA